MVVEHRLVGELSMRGRRGRAALRGGAGRGAAPGRAGALQPHHRVQVPEPANLARFMYKSPEMSST